MSAGRGPSTAPTPLDSGARSADAGFRALQIHEWSGELRFVVQGRVRPIVGGRASLDDVQVLHQRLRDRALLGRGVLVP